MSQKMFSKTQNYTHTLLQKPVFTPRYFSSKSTKPSLGTFPDNLFEWLFLYNEVFTNFISRKKQIKPKMEKEKIEMLG